MPKIKINVNGEEREVNIGVDDNDESTTMEDIFEEVEDAFEDVKEAKIKVKKQVKSVFNYRARIVSATPIICLAVYLTIGFVFDIWSPTWLIFLLIPIMPTVLYGFTKGKNIVMTITTIITFVAFFVLGFLGYWHPGWLVFFIIPIVSTLTPKMRKK